MQLGKTLVGAIIGAALGIGLLIAVFLLAGIDAVWMSIPVAVLTGLGVRTAVSTSGHPSYVRGAITVVLALAAYLGGWLLAGKVATLKAANTRQPIPKAAASEGPADKEEPGAEAPTPPPTQPAPMPTPHTGVDGMRRPTLQKQYSTWDIISLAVAALAAYELGRGTASKSSVDMTSAPDETMPAGTHPDA